MDVGPRLRCGLRRRFTDGDRREPRQPLSSLQDETIRTYYLSPPADFETALRQLSTDHIEPQAHFRLFFIAGKSHTMLGHPATAKVGTVTLWQWIAQMVNEDPAWTNLAP